MTRLLSRFWYYFWHTVTAVIGLVGLSMRIERRYRFPKTGAALLVANHQSFFDPPLIGLASDRELVYLARKTLFKHKALAGLMSSLGAVPIDQEGVGKEGIRTILEELGKGRAVLVFPEGSRTPDGRMHELKPGIHLLLKRSQAPIIPVGIAGAYDTWPIWRRFPLFTPLFLPPQKGGVAVVFGPALDSKRLAELPRAEALRVLAEEIAKAQKRAEEIRRKW